MTKRIAEYLSNITVQRGIYPIEKEKVLCYGIELLVTSIMGVLLMVIVSIIMGEPLSWILFLTGFVPLRTTAGGYHASTHLGCYIISTVMYVLSLLIAIHINIDRGVLIFLLLLAGCTVFFLSPIEAINKPLTNKIREINRRKSLIIIVFQILIVIFVCYFGGVNKIITMFCLGIFAAVISLGIAYIKKLITKGGVRDVQKV